MVIVLNHTICAAYLYFKDRDRFLTGGKSTQRCPSPTTFASGTSSQESPVHASYVTSGFLDRKKLQQTCVKLCGASDLTQLRCCVKEAVRLILSHTDEVIVYLAEPDNEDLVSCDGRRHTIPHQGIAWQSYSSQKRVLIQKDGVCDTHLTSLLNLSSASKPLVLSLPVLDTETKEVVAVLLTTCDKPTEEEESSLQFLTEQLSSCHRRMRQSCVPSSNLLKSRTESILQLCAELYDQDAASLQIKVIKYLQQQTQAQCGFVLLVVPEAKELFCQVIGDKVLTEEIRFPSESSSYALAMESKQAISLEQINKEGKEEIEKLVGIAINSLVCVPVASRANGQLIALMCLVNKLNSPRFNDDDIQTVQHCFKYTSTVLTSTLAVQNERRLKNETQTLLQVARNLFTHLDDLTTLLREIMQEARNLTKAERCSVFLIDDHEEELVAMVFDGVTTDNNEVQKEIRIPITQGIAGHVATTGELLNIRDAYSHPLFYRGIDESTGFRTRNILCFPIKDENSRVIGVAQLCNKKTGPSFSQFDEEIASAFSVYCCISIIHSLMYKKVIDAQHRNSLANELMMYHMKSLMYQKLQDSHNRNKLSIELMIYHMKVHAEDVGTICQTGIVTPIQIHPEFDQFLYSPRLLVEDETTMAVISMMEDLNFISRWRIKKDTLARFLLMVRKGYRNPPYHNWMHAYSVGHFCFLLVKNLKLQNFLDDVELFALFVSCLCHDIDHRGTNNSFQEASSTVLAALYSSEGSVMERHHFAQSMCIVNTDGCNIFENLSRRDYTKVLDLMRDVILATDIGHHLKIMKSLESMAKEGYSVENKKHHKLLLCVLMTACDLSDQTKNWKNTRKIAALIYQEFFSQGDMEKNLGKNPIEMMDRERARIPDLQISFLNDIALPTYRVIANMFPEAQHVLDTVEDNKRHWQKISEFVKQQQDVPLTAEQMLEIDVEEDSSQAPKKKTSVSSVNGIKA